MESFDGLANGNSASGLPPGAEFEESGTSALSDGNYTADDGSSNSGDVKNFGNCSR